MEQEFSLLGLAINQDKCQLFYDSNKTQQYFQTPSPAFGNPQLSSKS
jgi:hypothetical protein